MRGVDVGPTLHSNEISNKGFASRQIQSKIVEETDQEMGEKVESY
jgi:hypothetical protein